MSGGCTPLHPRDKAKHALEVKDAHVIAVPLLPYAPGTNISYISLPLIATE